jgi:branched-chain amino acid transport system substrate-binding protein
VRTSRKGSGTPGFLLAAAVLGACGGAEPPALAVVLPGWADHVADAVRAELGEWPARGLPEIRLHVEESVTGSAQDVDAELAERVSRIPGLVGVVGHGGSRESLIGAAAYNAAGVVQVVPTGTSRRLGDAGRWTFRLAPDDSVQGAFIARHAVERLGRRRALLFYVNDLYGVGLRDGVRSGLDAAGGTLLDAIPIEVESDHATLVQAGFLRVDPDVVIVATRSASAGRIARRVQEIAPGTPVIAGDGAYPPSTLADAAGPAAAAVHVVVFWVPDPGDATAGPLIERWERDFGVPLSSSEAMAYDAAMLLAEAIRHAGPRPEQVRRYLVSLGAGRPPYRGVTGAIAFHPDRARTLRMARIEDGAFVPLPER